jgi:xanthine dehydrogenase accessory factor
MWPQWLRDTLDKQACVLVTLDLVSGSAPRDTGARMVVTGSGIKGSIGGGNLEHQATLAAREMLLSTADGQAENRSYGLGPALNQCCGGAVSLRYEVFRNATPTWLEYLLLALAENEPAMLIHSDDQETAVYYCIRQQADVPADWPDKLKNVAMDWLKNGAFPSKPESGSFPRVDTKTGAWRPEIIVRADAPLFLFGAGHVGSAVVQVLQDLPFHITWVDSRKHVFPATVAENIECLYMENPKDLVDEVPAGSLFLVMTHSHEQDEDICHAVLSRNDFAWLGLIGSLTKRRRFVHRLGQRGIDESALQKLVCPVGLAGINGKQPATIAVAVAAQLLMELPQRRAGTNSNGEGNG